MFSHGAIRNRNQSTKKMPGCSRCKKSASTAAAVPSAISPTQIQQLTAKSFVVGALGDMALQALVATEFITSAGLREHYAAWGPIPSALIAGIVLSGHTYSYFAIWSMPKQPEYIALGGAMSGLLFAGTGIIGSLRTFVSDTPLPILVAFGAASALVGVYAPDWIVDPLP